MPSFLQKDMDLLQQYSIQEFLVMAQAIGMCQNVGNLFKKSKHLHLKEIVESDFL